MSDITTSIIMPDSITPVVGWRAWMLSADHALLSPTTGESWPMGAPLRARCSSLDFLLTLHGGLAAHETAGELKRLDGSASPGVASTAPAGRCSCGIYASMSRELARHYGLVLGRVALWGKVISHETGYRGEYAYPQALYVPDDRLTDLKVELAGYGVPVLPISSLEEASD